MRSWHLTPHATFKKVHDALGAGTIEGVYSVTLLTIEAIQRTDRATVMAGAQLVRQPGRISTIKNADLPDAIRQHVGTADVTAVNVEYKAVEPDRQLPDAEFVRRVTAAKALGLRVLKAVPRMGGFQYTDPAGEFYVESR